MKGILVKRSTKPHPPPPPPPPRFHPNARTNPTPPVYYAEESKELNSLENINDFNTAAK